jgi:hypothetical protein
MRRKQQGRSFRRGATKVSDEIAGISTDFCSGVIDPDLRPKTFHFLLQTKRNVALPAREAIDLDEFDEEVFKSLLIDHNVDLPTRYGSAKRTVRISGMVS